MDNHSKNQRLAQALQDSIPSSHPDLIWSSFSSLLSSISSCNLRETFQHWSKRVQLESLINTSIRRMVELYVQGKKQNDPTLLRKAAFYSLAMADRHKSTQTSIKSTFLFGGIGKPKPHKIPNHPTIFNPQSLEQVEYDDKLRARRKLIRRLPKEWIFPPNRLPIDEGEGDTEPVQEKEKVFPDLEDIFTISSFSAGNDIVLIVDNNTHRFVYDDRFTDYAYPAEKFIEDNSVEVSSLFILKNTRGRILDLLSSIEEATDGRKHKGNNGRDLLRDLSEVLDFRAILSSIGQNKHLIWIPDDMLRAVPFAFLLDEDDNFLFRRMRSVSQVHSLISFKWSLQKNFYYCMPRVRTKSPKVMFYGVPTTQVPGCEFLPGVIKEFDRIKKHFREEDICSFGDYGFYMGRDLGWKNTAAIDTFFTYHADADILWFSGHGFAGENVLLKDGSNQMRFHEAGIILFDSALSNLNLQSSGVWNFTRPWLIVMNACVTGMEQEIAREAVGFPASLYLQGAISMILSRTPVWDDIAEEFAEGVAGSIHNAILQTKTLGGRAQVFKSGLMQIFSLPDVEANPLLGAGYALMGIP